MKRLRSSFVVLLLALISIGTGMAAALAAADPDEVAAVVADAGYFIEPGSDASSARVSQLVSALRSEGEAVSLVVLAEEPPGGATTFAGAVFNRLGSGVVVVVAPDTVGWEGDTEVFGRSAINSSLDLALDGGTDVEVLELFTAGLTGTDIPERGDAATGDAATGDPTSSEAEGGGSGVLWVVLLLGVAVVAFVVWRRRRSASGPRQDSRLSEVRQQVQQQIDAVANDIIDLEAEVGSADNPEADRHYEAAGAAYSEAHDLFDTANTAEAYLDLSNRLDQAIWNLDAAEALLDGKSVPDQPEPRRLPAPEAAPVDSAAESAESGLPPRPDYAGSDVSGAGLPPRPSYPPVERRSGRRSSYGGGGIADLLAGMAAASMMRRTTSSPSRRSPPRRTTSSPPPGTSGTRSTPPKSDLGRGRGGGNRTRKRG